MSHTHGGYAEGKLREELNDIRQSGQFVIEAVKGVKHLRKNLTRFMQSDNLAVKREYDKLRRLVIKVLREIETVRAAGGTTGSILSLDRMKLEIAEKTEKISNGLDHLIREGDIDVQMATSLMNDISYCRETCWDLLEAGILLFSSTDLDEKAATQSIALDEHEIIEMMESPDTETSR